jgi:hypothetical protein
MLDMIRRIKNRLDKAERCHIDALDANDGALDGETAPKTALEQTRRAVDASRAHLDAATALCVKLLSQADASHDEDDPNEDDSDVELSARQTQRRRGAMLDALDRVDLGRGAAKRAPASVDAVSYYRGDGAQERILAYYGMKR